MNTVGGVELTTDPTWRGNPEVLASVTPVRVTIRNNGGTPVTVRYSDFQLNGQGRRYAAVPPADIQGAIAERPRGADEPERFYYDPERFLGTQWSDPYYEDRFYQGKYFGQWQETGHPREVRLPTPEMLQAVLPEGVVESGDAVSGFLYFQKVDPQEKRVDLSYRVPNPGPGAAFGTINVPLVVQRGRG